ncbi:MAG: pectate lyase [Candidatus Pedobacter colombiensis]|uniref:Pectate lyase n=1 Tax=Candidatus Pedobacter colombiensis TaxID=3121371 RepID=A0AAJ6B6Q8_9SPHI|nr:pectate lyase [Pedobacter sp.]WEK20282.1 MAG: pectate lyase [Pedobacter sp.]
MKKKDIIFSLLFFIIGFGCKKGKSTSKEEEPIVNNPNPVIKTPTPVTETALAFPGAEGYGKNTTGGRGGKVIKVTNLNDSGVGSLRAALAESGARIIVFEVSGNIKLNSKLQIKNGNVTIAGQTAPGDGICIQDYEMNVDADNVIIRYMRFRMGDLTKNEQDALWGRYHQNVIIDHCSMSWSIDECSSFYANKNFTMQWCILSESLNKSFHEKDDHGYGAIWGGTNASFHHNLLANHNSRNARFDGGNRTGTGSSPFGIDKVDYRNNVIYNWGSNSAYGGENGEYNMIANYYKPGPGTTSSKKSRIMEIYMETDLVKFSPGFGKFYIADNYMDGNPTVTQSNWTGVDKGTGLGDANFALAKMSAAFAAEAITLHTAVQAYNAVLLYGGASFKRDPIDVRIMKEVKDGTVTYSGSKTGKLGIIDSQTDVGGWPVLNSTPSLTDTDGDGMPDSWEIENGLDPKTANASGKDLSTGYTNIEVYINSLVKEITTNQVK